MTSKRMLRMNGVGQQLAAVIGRDPTNQEFGLATTADLTSATSALRTLIKQIRQRLISQAGRDPATEGQPETRAAAVFFARTQRILLEEEQVLVALRKAQFPPAQRRRPRDLMVRR